MTRKRLILATLAIAAAALVAIVARRAGASAQDAVLGVVIGCSFVASGLIAWARRPENLIGRVMVLAGLLRLAAEFCTGSGQPVLGPVGHLMHDGFWIAVAYVLLAFPNGRLNCGLNRWVFAGAVLMLPLDLAWFLLGGDRVPNDFTREWGDPSSGLALLHAPEAARALQRAEIGLVLLLMPLVIVATARTWRRATPRFRLALAPVLWTGAAGFAFMVLALADDNVGNPLGGIPVVLLDLTLAGVAVGFLVGVLRTRLARSAVAELVVELGRATVPGDLRDALARALRDPSLALAYWLPDGGRYVDVEGRPFEPPTESESRVVSVVEREGRKIAALVHDRALGEEPELVESVCAAAALALENERLQAELRARLEELRASRARVVEAADEERRRIERNLHDGTQQRLVSISMALGLAQAKLRNDPAAADAVFAEARRGLGAALEELRELSQGIHPGILTERGLGAALDELAVRATMPVRVAFAADRRLPEQVEATAYYVVCEALANTAKYAQATDARVHVEGVDGKLTVEVTDNGVGGADASRGSGLRGLSDRVEALGGRLWFSSPAGEGTILRAEIPCG